MINLTVEIDPAVGSVNDNTVRSVLTTVFTEESVSETDVTVIFGSDELLSSLKKEFFHVDQFTDVIAFRINDYDESNVEGEIYISLPRAKENASAFDNPLNEEVARLIIHGGLHLLNYDDGTDDEKQIMTDKENDYLSQTDWNSLAVAVD